MGRIRGHAKLNEDLPLFMMRQLVINGVTYEQGQELPWRTIQGVTPRHIRLWHDQRIIAHNPALAPLVGAEDVPRAQGEKRRPTDEQADPPAKRAPARNGAQQKAASLPSLSRARGIG
jgi:hypothetical protein